VSARWASPPITKKTPPLPGSGFYVSGGDFPGLTFRVGSGPGDTRIEWRRGNSLGTVGRSVEQPPAFYAVADGQDCAVAAEKPSSE